MENMSKRFKTKFIGVRYREHLTRKNGVMRDRYFSIRYKLDGKDKEEGIGWASQGMTAQIANIRLSELRENQRLGKGSQSLAEKKNKLKEKREKEQAEQIKRDKENVLFNDYFIENYFKTAMLTKKKETSISEKTYFKNWIKPAFKNKPFKDISPFDCEKLKKKILKAGRAPRTLQLIFAIIRQTWNMARRDGLVSTETPTRYVSLPKIDNNRQRFLSHAEADLLLRELAKRSKQLHDIALTSLHCSLRAGEIFKLEYSDINFENGILNLRDAKAGTRQTYMTETVKAMLTDRKLFAENKLVFPDRNGRRIKRVSNVFLRTVADIGFNSGITDRRQKVVFHTLRHTFASWLVQGGTDLYAVQKLMGHKSFDMVQRYAHLSDENLKSAIKNLEKNIIAENNVIKLKEVVK